MKKNYVVAMIFGLFLILLAGCGNQVKFKDAEDRETITLKEMSAIEEKVSKMDGVEDFTIDYEEGGIYANLSVKDKKQAKEITKEVFNLMWAETSDSIDLFVKPAEDTNKILIQVFKPKGTDNENEWSILL